MGALYGLAFFYLVGAYVEADFNWVYSSLSWDAHSRFFACVLALLFAGVGGMCRDLYESRGPL